jgi:hypothetical protein
MPSNSGFFLMDARVKPAHDETEAVQSSWLFEI